MTELFSTVHFTPLEASKAALLLTLIGGTIGGIAFYAIVVLLYKWISFSVSLESPWSEIVFYVPLIFSLWLVIFLTLISK